VRSHNKVRALFAKNKVPFARAEQLCMQVTKTHLRVIVQNFTFLYFKTSVLCSLASFRVFIVLFIHTAFLCFEYLLNFLIMINW